MSLESAFQADLIDDLEELLPDCFVMKNDANERQGIPDLLVLYNDKWAMLECKASAHAPERPNQRYYVSMFNEMSFSAFIYPENKEQVLHALQRALRPSRQTRVSVRQ